MKHLTISLFLLIGILLQSRAQLTVADDNNVGIGVTEPISKFAVGAAGNTISTIYGINNTTSGSQRAAQFYKSASGTSGGDWSYGLMGHIRLNGGYKLVGGEFQAYTSSSPTNNRTFGVRVTAGNGANGYNYGVYSQLFGSRDGAAIYANVGWGESLVSGKWAAYLRGNVYVEDTLIYENIRQSSDINLKKDIRLLSEDGVLLMDKLKTLNSIKYKLKTPVELNQISQSVLDTMTTDQRILAYSAPKYTKDQIGLSAQEVQIVFPELVSKGHNGYLSMNYIGLIPVLVEVLKEQDVTLNEQDDAIKLQNETVLALDEAVQAQAAKIEVLMEEIAKLQNPEKTQ